MDTRQAGNAGCYTAAVVALFGTADEVRRGFEAVFSTRGVSLQQYNVLRILRGARPQALPIMTIAERMIEKAPGITRLVDRLEEKGWLRRQPDADDRRRVNCVITRAGLEVLADLDGPVDAADAAAFGHLDPAELRQLISLLDRVRQRCANPETSPAMHPTKGNDHD